MVLSQNYELVEVAGEFLAVPIGDMAIKSKDIFTFSKAGGYLLEQLKEPKTEEDLVSCLVNEYDLDPEIAEKDVSEFVTAIRSYAIISE